MGASAFIVIKSMFRMVGCGALLLAVVAVSGKLSLAQMETATLSGTVMDHSGAVLPDTQVQVTNSDTNITVATTTNRTGVYVVPALKPGRYRVVVIKQGFKQVSVTDVILSVQDVVSRNFNLEVGATSESISVSASSADLQMSPAVSTVVDQRLVGELPLNGRSFQTLFQLTPGVVIVGTSFGSQGQFSVNGQRSNANYFMVDGAGANVGIAAGSGPGQTLGGSIPAFSAAGGTNSLVSTDAVQEFAIQTSSFAAEYGRTPGGQVSIVTKSGTNEFHGAVFDYFRNDIFDANDWFANHRGLKRAALRQNDFGGVVGGPIFKNKTFFFASYEGLRLRQPKTGQADVPTIAARNSAPAVIAPFLNAYPLPTGTDEGNGLAPANYTFSNPSRLDAGSIRLDHHFSQSLSVFGRYDQAPSQSTVRGSIASLNTITQTSFTLRTLTIGGTYGINSHLINDGRFNWSDSSGASFFTQDNFGGAIPLSAQTLFPAPFSQRDSAFEFDLSLSGINPLLAIGRNVNNEQRQINIVDGISWQVGAHLLKSGVDFRRLTPIYRPAAYVQLSIFLGVSSALNQSPLLSIIGAGTSPINATFTITPGTFKTPGDRCRASISAMGCAGTTIQHQQSGARME